MLLSMGNCLGNCVTCLKVNHSLFSELNKDELEILNQNRIKCEYSKGEFLYQEGDLIPGLICLNQGKVKLIKESKIENEFIVSLHKTVDFIGFDDLMSQSKCSSSAVALDNVSVCVILKEQFFKVIKKNPQLALKIIDNQSKKLIKNQDKLLNIAQSNLESRLAFALIQLVEFYGFDSDGKTLSVTIKRRELAAMSSMNTANAIRTLSKLKGMGIIEIAKKSIIILDQTKLKNLI